jgi:hypothetical protein
MLMKQRSDQYVSVNTSNVHTSKCWNFFSFPALIESIGEQPKKIERSVTCRLCSTTKSSNSNSTRLLYNHLCKTIARARSVSLSASLNSSSTYHRKSITSYVTNAMCEQNESRTNQTNDRLASTMDVLECTSIHRHWSWRLPAASTRIDPNWWVFFCHDTCRLFSN